MAGQILQKRYQLRAQLRAQPTRQTWLAVDSQAVPEQQFVIVKFLAFGRGMQWDELKLFEREVQVLQQLDHPHIPKYLDSFHLQKPEPWLGLIEEYIPGTSLQALVQQGHRFSESDIYDLAAQVLEILIYLHEQNPPILHRDIKPSNLIFTPNQQVFLVDFGAVQNQLSQTGTSFTVVGTYGYTPLEQFGGQAVPASDLYSLGASLVHLLTGMAPAELAQSDLRLQFRDRITLSNRLTTWLEILTAPALADRFESARAALTALVSLPSDMPDLPLSYGDHQRLQIETSPEYLQVRIGPIWSAPLLRLQDLANMTLLTLLGPLVFIILALLPLGMVYTRQAFSSGNIGEISVGILLLCFGGASWITSLNWLKDNLTSTLVESSEQRLVIKYQLFGWTYWQQCQPIADIISIYALPLDPEKNTVIIHFKASSPLTLANNLVTQDSQVLTDTLRNWFAY
ncbi:serine/threonine-protein kinase [Acaryochloris marina]|uniref:serine/threonine protein kinase n=1 Tax=Acaryochloris marina TaxID=155978 RepID=UPI00201832A8|nr:serine/threonine-protein kinase [Acaryochloris marina]